MENNNKLQLYGADWCTKSSALRNYLQSKWIEFDDFNVELDPEAASKVKQFYNGKLKFPTLVFDNEHLKNPTIKELNDFLAKYDIS